jgi:hypothetical protein
LGIDAMYVKNLKPGMMFSHGLAKVVYLVISIVNITQKFEKISKFHVVVLVINSGRLDISSFNKEDTVMFNTGWCAWHD